MTRRTVLLEEMFRDVANRNEINKLERIYAKGNKGAGTVFMLRIVKDYWDLHIAKKDQPAKSPTPLSDTSGEERFITFRSRGVAWMEKS